MAKIWESLKIAHELSLPAGEKKLVATYPRSSIINAGLCLRRGVIGNYLVSYMDNEQPTLVDLCSRSGSRVSRGVE